MATKITAIVNGQPTESPLTNESVRSLITRVLHATGNVGQEPYRWEARTVTGTVMDDRNAVNFYVRDGGHVFINLRAGVAA